MGGDPGNAKLVLSCSTLEFGKYQGQTFRWLMENDVGYAMHLVPVEAYGIFFYCANMCRSVSFQGIVQTQCTFRRSCWTDW